MTHKKSLSLSSWLLLAPLKFAFISFILIFMLILLMSAINPGISGTYMTLLTIILIICSAFIVYAKLPQANMDRHSFVALNNAQMFIVATAMAVALLLFTIYKNAIILKLMWLSTHSNANVIILGILISLFFLYLIGIYAVNIYAKYVRCREMGIKPWKIICSFPAGFGLLWIPGYLLEDKQKNNPAVITYSKWYSKLTNWILSKPIYATLTFVLITIYSVLFFGFNTVYLTLGFALIFAIWFKIVGLSTFRQHLVNIYSYFAIIVNVVLLICSIMYFSSLVVSDITVNINETEMTQIIN